MFADSFQNGVTRAGFAPELGGQMLSFPATCFHGSASCGPPRFDRPYWIPRQDLSDRRLFQIQSPGDLTRAHGRKLCDKFQYAFRHCRKRTAHWPSRFGSLRGRLPEHFLTAQAPLQRVLDVIDIAAHGMALCTLRERALHEQTVHLLKIAAGVER